MKKMAMVLLSIMVLSVLAIGTSEVEATTLYPGWYNTTVQSVGALPAPSSVFVIFATSSDNSWPNSRVFFLDGLEKPGLAAALTGLAGTGAVALFLPTGVAEATFVQGVTAGIVP